jgi:hypothetical protein
MVGSYIFGANTSKLVLAETALEERNHPHGNAYK